MRPFLFTFSLTAVAAVAVLVLQHRGVNALREQASQKHASAATNPGANGEGRQRPLFPLRQEKSDASRTTMPVPDNASLQPARGMVRDLLSAQAAVDAMTPEQLKAFLSIVSAMDFHPGEMERLGKQLAAWSRLGRMDPAGALAFASSLGAKGGGGHMCVLHDWLIRDRAGALAWFHQQPTSETTARFVTMAGMVLGGSDPALLAQLQGSIDNPDLAAESLKDGIISQSLTDFPAALARLDEIKDTRHRAEVLRMMAQTNGSAYPREVLDMMLRFPAEPMESYYLTAPLASLARKNPADCMDWLAERSEAEVARLIGKDAPAQHSLLAPADALAAMDEAAFRVAAARLPEGRARSWILASRFAGQAKTDPGGALASLNDSQILQEDRAIAAREALAGAVRLGREAELEPWIATQPTRDQEGIRRTLEKYGEEMKASGAAPQR